MNPFNQNTGGDSRRNKKFGAILLIGIGLIFLLDNFFPGFDLGKFWPLILIVIGLGMLWRR